MTAQLNENATCIGCGYRLANLPAQTCPECGRWFDPDDPSTYVMLGFLAGWRRWAKPPTIFECVLLAALSVYGVIGSSGPARWEQVELFFIGCPAIPAWFVLILLYVRRSTAFISDRARATRDEQPRRTSRLRWIVAPVCVLLVLSTIVWPWPLMLRFRLSHKAFEDVLADYNSGRPVPRSVGLYRVRTVTIRDPANRPNAVSFETGHSLFDPVGFEYDPHSAHPPDPRALEVAPHWFTYED